MNSVCDSQLMSVEFLRFPEPHRSVTRRLETEKCGR
jgi:hypothetical protein